MRKLLSINVIVYFGVLTKWECATRISELTNLTGQPDSCSEASSDGGDAFTHNDTKYILFYE